MSQPVEVTIFGKQYTVRGEADAEYIQRLADYVDGQMRVISQSMTTATPSKIAVLAALNIAHQLFQSERDRLEGEAEVERRALGLLESIEHHLDSQSLTNTPQDRP